MTPQERLIYTDQIATLERQLADSMAQTAQALAIAKEAQAQVDRAHEGWQRALDMKAPKEPDAQASFLHGVAPTPISTKLDESFATQEDGRGLRNEE